MQISKNISSIMKFTLTYDLRYLQTKMYGSATKTSPQVDQLQKFPPIKKIIKYFKIYT